MILNVYCKNCSKPIRIRSDASDRVELAKEKGGAIVVECHRCSKMQVYSPNDVIAERGLLNLILLLAMVFGTIIVLIYLLTFIDKNGVYSLYIIPVGISIPALIYFVWLLEENKRIKLFNRYRK